MEETPPNPDVFVKVNRMTGSPKPASRNACRTRPAISESGSFLLAAKERCMATSMATRLSDETGLFYTLEPGVRFAR